MAQVTGSNGTEVSGKINDRVYVRYRGGYYVRNAPSPERVGSTPAMLLNQQRFRCITRFCVQFKHTFIRQIWNDAATTCSGYNLFMKSNKDAFDKDGSIAAPLLLQFSVGTLNMPEELIVQRIDPQSTTLRISWTKEPSISGTRSRDELMMITSDGEHFSLMTPTGIKRKDVEGQVVLPAMPWAAGFIYLFFMSDDRRDFSGSKAMAI